MYRVVAFAIALTPLLLACPAEVTVFSGGGGGGPGDGGDDTPTTTSTNTSTTSSSSAEGGTSQGGSSSQGGMGQGGSVVGPGGTGQGGTGQGGTGQGGTGQGGMGQGGMGQGGGGVVCAHKLCTTGVALDAMCDPCVGQICQADPFCCNQMWDQLCVSQVDSVCNQSCFPTGMGPCGMQYPQNPVCSDVSECVLDYNPTLGSCNSICAAGGGECLGAFNDVNNQQCQIAMNQPLSCASTQFVSAICVCSKGCGMGPACMSGMSCVNGQCQ